MYHFSLLKQRVKVESNSYIKHYFLSLNKEILWEISSKITAVNQ